jgi:hypothetical protein
MHKIKKKAVFFVRAYNDLDCRLPLILKFAEDNYDVRVISIPLNTGYNHLEQHELFNYLKQKGIGCHSFFMYSFVPIYIKLMYNVHKFVSLYLLKIERKNLIQKFNFGLYRVISFCLLFCARNNGDLARKVIGTIKKSVLIIDEAVFQKKRSFVIDEIISQKEVNENSIYAFLCGQDTYTNLWFDKNIVLSKLSKGRIAEKYIVSSYNDKKIMERHYPDEDIVVGGNTRFDSWWLKTRAEIGLKNILENLSIGQGTKHKIVFMLSKIEYGVNIENLVQAINTCCSIADTSVILKPHTRGMSINEFRDRIDPRAIDGTNYTSTDLIEWSNTVLFTGSSIIFHAMGLGRKIIYLKYCQVYDTIFDKSDCIYSALDSQDLKNFIINKTNNEIDPIKTGRFLTTHVYNGIDSGLVSDHIKQQIEKWEVSASTS